MTVEQAMTVQEVMTFIKGTMNRIPLQKVFFKLKQYRVKYLSPQAVTIVRACLALHYQGLPITCKLVAELLDRDKKYLSNSLHTLGDKYVLLLKRTQFVTQRIRQRRLRFSVLEWMVHPAFFKLFEEA